MIYNTDREARKAYEGRSSPGTVHQGGKNTASLRSFFLEHNVRLPTTKLKYNTLYEFLPGCDADTALSRSEPVVKARLPPKFTTIVRKGASPNGKAGIFNPDTVDGLQWRTKGEVLLGRCTKGGRTRRA